jgi:protein TonB
MRARARQTRLALPVGLSAALHLAVAATALFVRGHPAPPPPPIYRVNILAAPPGERAVGVVTPAPVAPPPVTAPSPPRAETPVTTMRAPPTKTPPRRTPPAATPVPAPPKAAKPVPAKAPPPLAGGGPVGGRGADVATVRTEGTEFAYPGYLANIVRQIALRFRPPNPNAPLRAEVVFLIHRDGSVTGLTFRTRSGVYAFDLEAQGAIEAAAAALAFGPLPDGFPEDVLPVTFSFDPRLIK